MPENLKNELDFFDAMNTDLGQFYGDDSSEDYTFLYPLQEQLKKPSQRFREDQLFGAGGAKKIFAVTELSTERNIALARPHSLQDREVVESFLREARRTACLEHPNIIRVYDMGIDNEGPWFTMELVEGLSLTEKIQSHLDAPHSWSLYERLEIFNKICDAVSYAHSKDLLHLDIKPDNIRVGIYGEILLCDWGLSHRLGSDEEDFNSLLSNDQTQHGMIKGTPGYMAPERVKGEKSKGSDIYSMGALLFQLLTLRAPFAGNSLEEILEKSSRGELNYQVHEKIIPSQLYAVILKALEIKVQDRYNSFSKFINEISEAIDRAK